MKTMLMLLVIQRQKIIFPRQFKQSDWTLLSHGELLTLAFWSHSKKWGFR